jgi:hypothetical protein
MGFTEARKRAIECLMTGQYYAEDRIDSPQKNLLAKGLISPSQVIQVLKTCRGDRRFYEERPLDGNTTLKVHIFKTEVWYVKLYFIEPNCFVISVHKHD